MHYIPYYNSLTFFLSTLYMSASRHMGTTKNISKLFLPEIKSTLLDYSSHLLQKI